MLAYRQIRELAARLEAQNAELQAQKEELQAQHEELVAQGVGNMACGFVGGLQAGLGRGIAGIIGEDALIGGERQAPLLLPFRDQRVLQVDLGIGRIGEHALIGRGEGIG